MSEQVWPTQRLGDVARWLSGGTPSTDDPDYWDGDIPWISAASLKNFNIQDSDRRLTHLGSRNGSTVVPAGSTIFVVRGMSLKSELRVGVTLRPVAFGQDCKALIPNEGIDARYLSHAVKAAESKILALVDEASHGTGRLETRIVANQRIGVPSLAEQRRIVDILDTLDRRIELSEQILAKLARVEACVVDLFLGQCESDGLLSYGPLESRATPDRAFLRTGPFGSSLKGDDWTSDGIPVVTIGALSDGYIEETKLYYVSEGKAASLRDYTVREGDILFSRVADVGRSAVVSGQQSGWVMSSNLMRISVDHSRVDPAYVQLVIGRHIKLREQIRRFANSGGREIVNDAIMRKLKFPWVDGHSQRKLVSMVGDFRLEKVKEQRAREKLISTRHGLMSDLMTGYVRVPATDER
ncbi:restriction endonuclease subunit S [Streptomyces sp. NBC_00847]|uniref:restriction endonuclease subunit S n=1 Tax=unclassified Streptomyces TaxID=2593676 RepID=UPI00224F930A|nr:restriction endonuclease subunit S [Streptomyces sp. NBC_00847]MCX4882576.1 restriction endonuclease subunit S [Streptomyces sp. NBC_00847]